MAGMKRFTFQLRDIFLLVLVTATALGWFVDRAILKAEIEELQIANAGMYLRIVDLTNERDARHGEASRLSALLRQQSSDSK